MRNRRRPRGGIRIAAGWLVGVAAATAASAAGPDFVGEVRPILEARCGHCHAGEAAKSGLRLDVKSAAFRGGDLLGAAILPGRPDESPLVRVVRGDEEGLRMPPDDAPGGPLAPAEIERLSAWVAAGAEWPDGVDTAVVVDRRDHWAFKPIVAVPPPPVRNTAWPRDPLDRFVLARLEAEGLAPSAATEPATWLRRVASVLTGLPPAPELVDRFPSAPTESDYERVVDELLASPRHGERMAQHWLDVVRYADTHGYEVNTERPNAWPYRDYVIAAFNTDTPYDRFVREQIAGDGTGQDAATGFLVTAAVLLPGQIGADDVSKRLARQDALHDILINVGETFLGMSVGCARCHDHKFDPFTQRDYYRLQAVFSGVRYEDRPLETPEAVRLRGEAERLRARVAEIDRRLTALEIRAAGGGEARGSRPARETDPPRPTVNARLNVESFPAVAARRIRMTILATNTLEPCIDELEVFDAAGLNVAAASAGGVATASGSSVSPGVHELPFVNDGRYGNGRSWMAGRREGDWVCIELPAAVTIDRVAWGRDREGTFTDRLATAYRVEVSPHPAADGVEEWTLVADATDRSPFDPAAGSPAFDPARLPDDQRAEVEALRGERSALDHQIAAVGPGQMVFAGRFTTPDPVHLLHRGDPEQPREPLEPAPPELFAAVVPPPELAADTAEATRRRVLAEWLVHPAHPLVARVIVNRVWQWHFGTGLVETASDFGRAGQLPSHPDLLDTLAADFVREGWSLKRLHRRIALSATFRQAAGIRPAADARDADCRLLWRFPARRLEAEAIRDAMLATSGRLNLEMGGRGFDLFGSRGGLSGFPPIETFTAAGLRRMIYAHKIRMERDSVFGAFDCPDAGQTMARRRQSTTPIQALNLFNSPFTLDEAAAFAARVEREVPAADATAAVPARVARAFRLALGRDPDAAEATAAAAVVRDHGLAAVCRVLFNAAEFVTLP